MTERGSMGYGGMTDVADDLEAAQDAPEVGLDDAEAVKDAQGANYDSGESLLENLNDEERKDLLSEMGESMTDALQGIMGYGLEKLEELFDDGDDADEAAEEARRERERLEQEAANFTPREEDDDR